MTGEIGSQPLVLPPGKRQALEPNGIRFCLVCLEAASIGSSLIGGGTNLPRHLAGIFRVGFRKRQGLRG